MTERFKVGTPKTEDGKTIFPVVDSENEKLVRHGYSIKEAKRIAYHYNKAEVWND